MAESIYERLKSGDVNVEERRLDIKKQWHHSQSNRAKDEIREEFCKDICALANSSYPSSGYLIFGLSPDSPFLFSAPIPMDEASLQQQIAAGISPVPEVRFCSIQLSGTRLDAAVVLPTLKGLPYVARYKNNLWIPWVRQGSSTRSASHLDLVSMFDFRAAEVRQAIPRLKIVAPVNWAGNWSAGVWAWSPSEGAPKSGAPISGLHTTLRFMNSGLLPTALVSLSARLEWSEGSFALSSSCNVVNNWPIHLPERAGSDLSVTFYFRDQIPDRADEATRLTIIGTDLDDRIHEFEFDKQEIGVS
jgi:hypothetical protein